MTATERGFLMGLMKIKKIKSKELATKFELSEAYVSDILNGRRDGPQATEWVRKFDEYVNKKEA